MALTVGTDDKGLKIWRNDEGQYPRYSYTISRKNQSGEWENCYQSIKFKKDVSVANGAEIKIGKAFFSFDTGKDGKKYPYLMVMEFEVIGGMIDIPEAADEDEAPFK